MLRDLPIPTASNAGTFHAKIPCNNSGWILLLSNAACCVATMTNNGEKCRSCGASLAEDAPSGHCPACLLRLGMPAALDQSTIAGDSVAPGGGTLSAEPPRRFGDYELLEEIARGGMGVVYKARQRSLDRIVALKMILSGQFASREYIQRFRAEAASAAMLQHPNIVAIHEVGVNEGQHFFSMDYVQGRTLAEIVREGPLSAKRAATYLKTIAEAIHYAHGRGILHRDLKPSNVLIDADKQRPVTDSGLAKHMQRSSELTLTGQMLGSPNYMPPEQAGMGSRSRREPLASNSAIPNPQSAIGESLVTSAPTKLRVGPSSDVYGLGAILYHLLTGRPPFQAETLEQVLVQLREQEPLAPRLLNASIPRDLETICLKCLEKESMRRYRTAGDLSEELRRFLNDEPIQAQPANQLEKLVRWCRRKPVVASLAIGLVIAIGLGFAGVLWQSAGRQGALRATAKALTDRSAALKETKQALIQSRQNLYAAQMNLVQQAWNDGAVEHAQALLRAQIPQPGEEDLRGFEWRHFRQLCRDESVITITNDLSMAVQSVAVSPDGAMIAFGGMQRLLRVWRFDSQDFLPRFNESSNYIRSLVFLPNGTRVACGYVDGTIKLWDHSRAELHGEFKNLTGMIECVRVSSDGCLLAGAEKPSGTVRLFSLESMRELATIPGPPHDRPALAFSPDGKTFAISRGDLTVVLWDLERMTESKRLPHAELTVGLGFSPDGRWLAGAGADAVVRVWDIRSPGEPAVLRGHKAWVSSVSISPDGSQLATSCMDGTIKLWDMASRSELRTLRGHKAWVNNVVFTPDGTKLVSSSDDQTVKVWNLKEAVGTATVSAELDTVPLKRGTARIAPSVFSPDGKLLVTGSREKDIVLWDAVSERPVGKLSGHTARVTDATFSPDGRQLASVSDDQTVRVWNVQTRQEIVVFEGHTAPGLISAFSPDGRVLASAGADGTVRLWDVAARTPVATLVGHKEPVFHLVFTPDGRTLLSGSNRSIRGWGVERGEPAFELPNFFWEHAAAVSPDGTTMTINNFTNKKSAVLWDLNASRRRAALTGHRDEILMTAYSIDGTLLATASRDTTIMLWATATGKLLHTLSGHSDWVISVAFSPDGRTLASSSHDGTVRLWSLVSYQQVAALRPVGPFTSVTFSPDGGVLAARGAEDGRVRLWHAPTFQELEEEIATVAAKAGARSK